MQEGGVRLDINNEFTSGHMEFRVLMKHSGRDVKRVARRTGVGLMKEI